MKTLALTLVPVLLFASIVLGAESRAVDGLEDIGADGTLVTSRIVNGVTVDIATASGTMTAWTYDEPPTAFVGPGGSSNAPLNPENVSGTRFISTSGPPSGYFQNVQPITFTFSQPVQSFGLTTLDLMTTNLGATETVTLQAFNTSGDTVGQVTRSGPQGAEGVDLDWLVQSNGQDIVGGTLTGAIVTGGGYGIDDLVLGRPTGNLSVWGNDEYSQVGSTPTSGNFKAVAAGSYHNLVLKTDGSLAAWGADGHRQVSDTPTGNDFVAIGAGHSHNVALQADGSIAAWGSDGRGKVSNAPSVGQFAAVAAGVGHSVALSSDGSLVSWGSDDYGLVADTPSGVDFKAVDATLWHTVALKDNGTIVSWGIDGGSGDDYGQVTDTPSESDFIAIAAGGYHNLALQADGSLVSWGRDLEGQVSDTPTGNDFVAIAAGYYHSLALKSDGTIVPWGLDEWGEIMHAPPGTEFTAISAGKFHSIALVPEPATLSLLALGGLAILKRRKACH
jgi:alpha-tubulin suppressor-like RCC1 family protein